MRHRARRPVLDRLRNLATAHRGAAVVVAVLTGTAATGVALTVPGDTDSMRAGSPGLGGDAPSYQADPAPGSTLSGSPTDPATRQEQATGEASPSALGPTRAEAQASRTTDRAQPTERLDPTSSAPPRPEPVPTGTDSTTAAPAPDTSATTRTAIAGRWVIGLSSDSADTFECSLDGGGYQPCGSTVAYDDLAAGEHTFSARATADGTADPSPATLTAVIGSRGPG